MFIYPNRAKAKVIQDETFYRHLLWSQRFASIRSNVDTWGKSQKLCLKIIIRGQYNTICLSWVRPHHKGILIFEPKHIVPIYYFRASDLIKHYPKTKQKADLICYSLAWTPYIEALLSRKSTEIAVWSLNWCRFLHFKIAIAVLLGQIFFRLWVTNK